MEHKEILLIKNGELALKGLNRGTFEDILLKNTTTMKKRIHLTETGNFHIGETDVDEKCTK